MCAMNATIDKAGRLVVPKAIREAAQLEPGTEVRFRVVSGHVEIEPVPLAVKLERRGRFVVAVPSGIHTTLKASVVDKAIAEVRSGIGTDNEAS